MPILTNYGHFFTGERLMFSVIKKCITIRNMLIVYFIVTLPIVFHVVMIFGVQQYLISQFLAGNRNVFFSAMERVTDTTCDFKNITITPENSHWYSHDDSKEFQTLVHLEFLPKYPSDYFIYNYFFRKAWEIDCKHQLIGSDFITIDLPFRKSDYYPGQDIVIYSHEIRFNKDADKYNEEFVKPVRRLRDAYYERNSKDNTEVDIDKDAPKE